MLVFRPIRKRGCSEKLLHRFHGPFRIVRRLNEINFLIESVRFGKKHLDTVHVSKLKPFHRRPFGNSLEASECSLLRVITRNKKVNWAPPGRLETFYDLGETSSLPKDCKSNKSLFS